jgi:glycerol kinase
MIWNRHSGKPVANAAVWQCQRGAQICDNLKEKGYSETIKRKPD